MVGNTNGDTPKPDVVTCNLGSNTISEYRKTSTGGWSHQPYYGFGSGFTPWYFGRMAAARFDSDGPVDLVCVEQGGLGANIFLHDPVTKAFVHSRPSDTSGDRYRHELAVDISGVDAGRIDVDGNRDFVIGSKAVASGTWALSVLRGNGDGTFHRNSESDPDYLTFDIEPENGAVETGAIQAVLIVDLNDDGKNDLVATTTNGNFAVLLNTSGE